MSAVQEDRPWTADAGDGTYRNPVLNADWSDPDVVRVGEDFYLTASSFGRVPGLPLLHSRDLVNWSIVGHALDRLEPAADFAVPRHDRGCGRLRCGITPDGSGSSGATPTTASSRSAPRTSGARGPRRTC